MPSLHLGFCKLKTKSRELHREQPYRIVFPMKMSSGIFNSQVPGGMDVNENMVEGGGELELVEGGAEK